MKKQILKEFWLKLRKNIMWRDSESGIVERHITELINEIIAQTREETIRELEDEMDERIERGKFLPDLSDTESYYSGLYNAYQEIKYLLNKLKK